MSKATAPPQQYGYDQPPAYDSLQGNAGSRQNYGSVPVPTYATNYQQQQPPLSAPQPAAQVVFVGGCPACRIGVLDDDFTVCGVLCAILFFPFGILCCLAMKQRRCTNCGAIFG